MNAHELLRQAEQARPLDRPAAATARALRRLWHGTRLDRLLRGSWLGHPVHPIMVTVPIGAWTSAAVLDATGQPTAARRLVGLGLLTVPPSVLVGLADFAGLPPRQRRVAAVHALANAATTACFLVSYLRRPAGGRVWTMAGLAAMGVAGALGGHLSYAQGAGVHRWQEPEPEPGARAPGGSLTPVG